MIQGVLSYLLSKPPVKITISYRSRGWNLWPLHSVKFTLKKTTQHAQKNFSCRERETNMLGRASGTAHSPSSSWTAREHRTTKQMLAYLDWKNHKSLGSKNVASAIFLHRALEIRCKASRRRSREWNVSVSVWEWTRPTKRPRQASLSLCQMDGYSPEMGTYSVKKLPIRNPFLDKGTGSTYSSLVRGDTEKHRRWYRKVWKSWNHSPSYEDASASQWSAPID